MDSITGARNRNNANLISSLSSCKSGTKLANSLQRRVSFHNYRKVTEYDVNESRISSKFQIEPLTSQSSTKSNNPIMSTSILTGAGANCTADASFADASLTFIDGPQAISTPLATANNEATRRSLSMSDLTGGHTTLNVFRKIERYVSKRTNNDTLKNNGSPHPSILKKLQRVRIDNSPNDGPVAKTAAIFNSLVENEEDDENIPAGLSTGVETETIEPHTCASLSEVMDVEEATDNNGNASRLCSLTNLEILESINDNKTHNEQSGVDSNSPCYEVDQENESGDEKREMLLSSTPLSRPLSHRRIWRKTIDRTWLVGLENNGDEVTLLEDIEIDAPDIFALSDNFSRIEFDESHAISAENIEENCGEDSALNSPFAKKLKPNTPIAAKLNEQSSMVGVEDVPLNKLTDDDICVGFEDELPSSPVPQNIGVRLDASLMNSLRRSRQRHCHQQESSLQETSQQKVSFHDLRRKRSATFTQLSLLNDSDPFSFISKVNSTLLVPDDESFYAIVREAEQSISVAEVRELHEKKQEVYTLIETIVGRHKRLAEHESLIDAELKNSLQALKLKLNL